MNTFKSHYFLSIKDHCFLQAKVLNAYEPIDFVYETLRNSLEGERYMT